MADQTAGAAEEAVVAGRRLRVFLVDDHAMFRAGVRAELGAHVDVVGEASTVAEAVSRIASTEPDVVLLDVHMPEGGGRAVLEAIRRTHPHVRFLALSVSDAAEDVIGLIRSGARGYVTKTISPDDLAAAVRRVADGDAVFSPRLAGFVLDAFAARPDAPVSDPELDQLTTVSGRCCACLPEGTRTRRSPRSCTSRSRRWRHMCRTCSVSSRCPAATSCPAGRRIVGWSEP